MPFRARRAHAPDIDRWMDRRRGKESVAMFHPDQTSHQPIFPMPTAAVAPSGSRACLVEGCPCKDARIVSLRRAAFFAAMARRNGETADRVIAPDPAWSVSGTVPSAA
jgi:hypothetical protein